jgi:CDP-glycerol glycerophosphotransferase
VDISLTIGITLFNKAKYIENLANSLLGLASISNIELLFVDDCSTDNSGFIAKERFSNHARFIFLPQNAGVSAARNELIAHSSSEYLTFLDADDFIDPGNLLYLIRSIYDLNLASADLILCPYENLNAQGEVIKYSGSFFASHKTNRDLSKLIFDYLLIPNRNDDFVQCFSKLYRRDFLVREKIMFDSRLKNFEDVDFIAQILFCSPSVANIGIPFYSHVVHAPGLSETCNMSRSLYSHFGFLQSTNKMILAYKVLSCSSDGGESKPTEGELEFARCQAVGAYTCIALIQNCAKVTNWSSFWGYYAEVVSILKNESITESFLSYCPKKAGGGSPIFALFVKYKLALIVTLFSLWKYRERYL